MADELALYLDLSVILLDECADVSRVVVEVEPEWDGCAGRWLNIDVERGPVLVARLCAVGVLSNDGESAPRVRPEQAHPLLDGGGWRLHRDADPDWGFWTVQLPELPREAARQALTPALALFDVYRPDRWFVTVSGDTDRVVVDLREWRRQVGLGEPPATIAPRGSEPWAILCDCGFHERHEPPCWDPPA